MKKHHTNLVRLILLVLFGVAVVAVWQRSGETSMLQRAVLGKKLRLEGIYQENGNAISTYDDSEKYYLLLDKNGTITIQLPDERLEGTYKMEKIQNAMMLTTDLKDAKPGVLGFRDYQDQKREASAQIEIGQKSYSFIG
jgi:hypothetical protein